MRKCVLPKSKYNLETEQTTPSRRMPSRTGVHVHARRRSDDEQPEDGRHWVEENL